MLDYIAVTNQDGEGAKRWLVGFELAVQELENDPRRHRRIDESAAFTIERQKLYHSHRLIFTVDDATQTVNVLRVYHQSRKPLRRKMIP